MPSCILSTSEQYLAYSKHSVHITKLMPFETASSTCIHLWLLWLSPVAWLHHCFSFFSYWLSSHVWLSLGFLTCMSGNPEILEYLPELDMWEGMHQGWELKLDVAWELSWDSQLECPHSASPGSLSFSQHSGWAIRGTISKASTAGNPTRRVRLPWSTLRCYMGQLCHVLYDWTVGPFTGLA